MLGVLVTCHLSSSWRDLNTKAKLFDMGLIMSSATYIILYYFIIYLHKGKVDYASMFPASSVTDLISSYLDSDPFLIVFLIPILVWRAFKIIIQKQNFDPIYDSMTLAAITYILVYIKLDLHGVYYLQPAYLFTLIPTVFFLSKAGSLSTSVLKVSYIFTCFFIAYTRAYNRPSLPLSFDAFDKHKYVAMNYDSTLDFLTKDIANQPLNKRANIFLGLNRNSGYEAYLSFGKFLEYKGLTSQRFDLKSDTLNDKTYNFQITNSSSPYTVFKSTSSSIIQKGDYIVILPASYFGQTTENHIRVNSDHTWKGAYQNCTDLNHLDSKYHLIFRTKNQFTIPLSLSEKNPSTSILCRDEPNFYVFKYQ